MKLWCVRSVVTLAVASGIALGQSADRNPVDELKERAAEALAAANLPFTAEQEKQLAIAIEDEHLAAENLFGTVWDFSNGPPQGEDRDRMLAGIRCVGDLHRPNGLGKNTEVGPHYFDVSFNISKVFPLQRTTAGTGAQVNVFANLFNAFNMAHLGNRSGVMTSPFFGKSYNTSGTPRTVQIGMRFQF